eukprot:1547418-Heterocapsa_arctica.AAC.2
MVPPKEDKNIRAGPAGLCREMYETCNAAQCFDAFAKEVMTGIGFKTEIFNQCLYYNAEKGDAKVVVDGMNKKVIREAARRDARATQGHRRRPGDSGSPQVDTLGELAARAATRTWSGSWTRDIPRS